MSEELDEIIAANAERRAAARDQADADAALVADAADQITHRAESDSQRAARRAREAERERLRALGVRFDG